MAGEYVYNLASEETYEDGQTIIKEGSPGDWVYVILSGSVEISKTVRGKKCVIEVLQTDEVFGELGFIGGNKRTALYEQGGRSEPRLPKVLSITYKEREAFISAYTANASSGGLFIKTEKPLKVGFQFILKLQLPGVPNPLQIKSEVRWARSPEKAQPGQPTGMGIEFLEISENDTRVLKECLVAPEPNK